MQETSTHTGSHALAIILSGGVGSRMGSDIPKQYLEVNGRAVIDYALHTMASDERIDGQVITVAPEWRDHVAAMTKSLSLPVTLAPAGETRQYSIYNALRAAVEAGYSDDTIVIIHDAARPFVSSRLIGDCIAALDEGYDGALPVLPVKDTIYQSPDGVTIGNLLPRQQLWAGQAPESFRLGAYLALHDNCPREQLLKINGSTEIAFNAGWRVKLIPGEESNFKVTTPDDLKRMTQFLEA